MIQPPIVPACPDCSGVKWLYLGAIRKRYRCIDCGRVMTYAQLSLLMRAPQSYGPVAPEIQPSPEGPTQL